jgi:hypothetical protein
MLRRWLDDVRFPRPDAELAAMYAARLAARLVY